MIVGVHTILYSRHADDVRTFFREVLEFPSVDAGHGWLIFAAPPGELAIHPTEEGGYHELYLMCSDIQGVVDKLKGRGVEFTMPISDRGWGLLTQLKLPGGETLGLYEPRHPTAIRVGPAASGAQKKSAARARPPANRTRKSARRKRKR